jgi:acetyl esterase/lipase
VSNDENILVVFSHGRESGPWGSKISALADLARSEGAEVLSVDYREDRSSAPDDDITDEARRRITRLLSTTLPPNRQLILVGSSLGGYVSVAAAAPLGAAGLFLLAPALSIADLPPLPPISPTCVVEVVHGWSDDVIPWHHSAEFCKRQNCALHLVPGDHRLNDALPMIAPLFVNFLLAGSSSRRA